MFEKAEKYLSKATEYESQAKAESYYEKSVPRYDKTISLYESAIRDSKYALNKVFEKSEKEKIKADINRLRAILDGVRKDREALHKKIKQQAVYNKAGMRHEMYYFYYDNKGNLVGTNLEE